MGAEIDELQAEIEFTRNRLRSNLRLATSDASIEGLQETFQDQAQRVTQDAISKARHSGEGFVSDLIDGVKERATANPLAVLAIGAGLGWKLWKNPPVASVLVGAGLYGLFAKGDLLGSARSSVQEKMDRTSKGLVAQFDAATDSTVQAATKLKDDVKAAVEDTAAWAEKKMPELPDIEARNVALLSAASLAVAAAVGLAIKRYRED